MKKISLIIALIPFLSMSQNAVETEFIKKTNAYRDSLGLSPIEYDSNLSLASKYHLQYLIKGFETGLISVDSMSHYQNIDLPGFDEIVSPKERIKKLTNFEPASEIVALYKISSNGKDVILNPSEGASRFLSSFKRSPGHHKKIIQNHKYKVNGKEETLKMGVSSHNGILVVVYGYSKSIVK